MTDVQLESVELIDAWLWNLLRTDAALTAIVAGRVSNTLSTAALATPYVTFSLNSTRDVRTTDGQIIATDSIYLVKVVNAGASWDVVRPAARRINALLQNTRATVTNGSLTSTRDREVKEALVENGVQYRHLGGLYRIRASAHP